MGSNVWGEGASDFGDAEGASDFRDASSMTKRIL
jgi:hypothetical protein